MTEEFQRGVIPLARYQEQQLPEYQDNPLISALPPIPDLQEVVGLLQQLPGFEPQEALLDGRLRAHAIARLLHGFFQPLSHHLELESKISLMIRQGYIGRNPAMVPGMRTCRMAIAVSRRRIWMRRCTRVSPLRPTACRCSAAPVAARRARWSGFWACTPKLSITLITTSPNWST